MTSRAPLLNIFSIRSVMRKPLTMLVIDAKSAIAPSSVMSGGWLGPGDEDRADDGDGRDGVGQRHQRRVQQPRDPGDDAEADEGRQHEDEEERDELSGGRGVHDVLSSPALYRHRRIATIAPRR